MKPTSENPIDSPIYGIPSLEEHISGLKTLIAEPSQQAGLEVVSNETPATWVRPPEPKKEFSERMSEKQWKEYEKVQHQSSKVFSRSAKRKMTGQIYPLCLHLIQTIEVRIR